MGKEGEKHRDQIEVFLQKSQPKMIVAQASVKAVKVVRSLKLFN
jgi:hypothetical protein